MNFIIPHSMFLTSLVSSMRTTVTISFSVLLLVTCTSACAEDTNSPSPQDIEFFEKKIRPVLAARCYSCHSNRSKTVKGSLKVDSRGALIAGGDSGSAIVPGKPQESLLIAAIQFKENADVQMPPKGKLPAHEIDALTEWVRRGAPFPGGTASTPPAERKIDFAEARKFWSFVPVEQKPLPKTKQADWAKQRIDHFVLAAMEANGLSPSEEADRATLLRRLTFDLTGLPPTPGEVTAFINDKSPPAYQAAVERLLNSKHFGERWARVWLDLARYTDRTASWLYSTGHAHLYRDWVVQALNDDMPYDQFVHRQLATDFMPETGSEDIAALGFLGLSPNYWKELQLPSEIIKVIVADEWEERIDTVSRTFLGLTVACARCHHHKFDAITMQDYYALAGVFASCRIKERPTIDESLYAPVRTAKTEIAKHEAKVKELKKKKPQPKEEIDALTAKIVELKKTPYFSALMAPAVTEESLSVERKGKTAQSGTKLVYHPRPQDLHLFVRGNPNRLGDLVPRRFLQVLSRSDQPTPFKTGSGRLELAQAITTDAHPLAARVLVNRIWLAHFGRGLVTTPSNFGQSGERPSHPELLDDLAARFIAGGWSMKKLHREIVLSATYRQSSRDDRSRAKTDPDNLWLSRMPRTRLSVEAWRDAMLAVSGELDKTIGGPSVGLTDAANKRRTIYCTIHRREMSTMLLTHDFPDPTAHSPQRVGTTTTLQGLYALNGPMMLTRSKELATRLLNEELESDRERVSLAYQLLFAREPSERETKLALDFVGDTTGKARENTWMQYAHVLLASNEFLFVN
ncbi:MAG: PSD1 and planctomycete cytochrome C domain-containing protein [Pirellulaceae bacterium]